MVEMGVMENYMFKRCRIFLGIVTSKVVLMSGQHFNDRTVLCALVKKPVKTEKRINLGSAFMAKLASTHSLRLMPLFSHIL